MKRRKKITWFLVMLAAMLLLAGCGGSSNDGKTVDGSESSMNGKTRAEEEKTEETGEETAAADETWAVYWYLCGSDLESQYGAASMDLAELTSVELPENVTFVIQTGGANEWQNELMDASELGRYVYNKDGFAQVDSQELASMGKVKTLTSFLSFCEENYPADHAMVLFWNHGGGSEGGVEFDEIFENDSLTLPELDKALATATKERKKNYDIIGFDTCLMGTLENASIMRSYADYMVASEETEPGNGWNYEGIAQSFVEEPSISAKELGIAICDAYMTGCEMAGTQDSTTLSLIDLSKVENLVQCVDLASLELVAGTVDKPSTASKFIRSGYKAENYGGNNDEEGYFNQVDLGDLVARAENLLPGSAQEIHSALEEAVIYKVNGKYRASSTGLSIYFPYGISEDSLVNYGENLSANPLYSCFLRYIVEGEYPEETLACVEQMQLPEEMEEEMEPAMNADKAEGVSVFSGDMQMYQNEDGYMALELDPEEMDSVASVKFYLYSLDEENELMILLGSDNNINADWENGYFEDNFSGYWGCLDGQLCYMELVYEGEDYNLYSVPVKLNGEECVLRVAYNFSDEAFEILGAIPADEEDSMGGAAQKNLIKIVPGDKIKPKLYCMDLSGRTEELVPFYMDKVTVTEDTVFQDEDMGDSAFMYMFEVEDLAGNTYTSDVARMDVKDGEITTEILEP